MEGPLRSACKSSLGVGASTEQKTCNIGAFWARQDAPFLTKVEASCANTRVMVVERECYRV